MPEEQTYNRVTAAELKAMGRNFEYCKFNNCDFSYADLSNLVLADCLFTDCNLALATVNDTGWQNINFTGCKLSGIHFNKSSNFLFELHFSNCVLDNAIFYQKKNKKARFENCSLIETDFTEADLTDAVFENCNLNRAYFSRTKLQGADFRTSYNFIINPEDNMLKKAKFSYQGLPGLLVKYGIVVQG